MERERTWQEIAPLYDERARQYERGAMGTAEAEPASRKYRGLVGLFRRFLPPAGLVLDTGAGDGRYTTWLLRHGYSVVATDISFAMLMVARQYVTRRADPLGVSFLAANLEQMPLVAGRFDAIVCAQVLEHLLDDELGLHELARLLKPGGTLILTTDNRENVVSKVLDRPVSALKSWLGMSRFKVPFPHRDYVLPELLAKVEQVGFHVVHVDTIRWSLPSPLRRIRPVTWIVDRVEERLSARWMRLRRHGDLIHLVAVRNG